MTQTTSRTSQDSPTFAAENGPPDWLRRPSPIPPSEQITLAQFAKELGVATERVQPLIDREYLTVLFRSEDSTTTIVARPLPGAFDWLRTMFMPLVKRPYLPTSDAAAILGITDKELRFICVTDNIQIYDDPVFGELLSASGFVNLKKGLISQENAIRFDRQTIMLILARLKRVRMMARNRNDDISFPYNERIEREIQRISALPEPERTLRATDLWAAFSQADTVTDCLKQYEGKLSHSLQELHSRMKTLEDKVTGVLPWDTKKAHVVRMNRAKRAKRKAAALNAQMSGESASGALPSDPLRDDMSSVNDSET